MVVAAKVTVVVEMAVVAEGIAIAGISYPALQR
jgi:hypothetical protein